MPRIGVDDIGLMIGMGKIFGVFPPFARELELGVDTPDAEADEVPDLVGKSRARSEKAVASALAPSAFCRLIFRPVLWSVLQSSSEVC